MENQKLVIIFGYGETQLITEALNKKVLTSELIKVQPVIDNIFSFKPDDNTAINEYYLITINNDGFGKYTPTQTAAWETEFSKLDAIAFEELVAEIEAHGVEEISTVE
jgi:hypothetical protein